MFDPFYDNRVLSDSEWINARLALLDLIKTQEQTIAAQRPVVEAAVAWRGTYGWTPKMEVGARAQALVAAVDAYRERG